MKYVVIGFVSVFIPGVLVGVYVVLHGLVTVTP